MYIYIQTYMYTSKGQAGKPASQRQASKQITASKAQQGKVQQASTARKQASKQAADKPVQLGKAQQAKPNKKSKQAFMSSTRDELLGLSLVRP